MFQTLKLTFIIFSLCGISFNANADIECKSKKIEYVMLKNNTAYIQFENTGWQILALPSDPSFDKKFSRAIFAREHHLEVDVTYSKEFVDVSCFNFAINSVVKGIKVKKK